MITTDEYVDAKIDEIREILSDYDVFEHDVETIIGIIEHLGNLLSDTNKAAKLMEKYVRDEFGAEAFEKMTKSTSAELIKGCQKS